MRKSMVRVSTQSILDIRRIMMIRPLVKEVSCFLVDYFFSFSNQLSLVQGSVST